MSSSCTNKGYWRFPSFSVLFSCKQVIMVMEEIPHFKLYCNLKKRDHNCQNSYRRYQTFCIYKVEGRIIQFEYAFQVTCGCSVRGLLGITACSSKVLESMDRVSPFSLNGFKLVCGRESWYLPVSSEAAKGIRQARLLRWFIAWLWINFDFCEFFVCKIVIICKYCTSAVREVALLKRGAYINGTK